MKKLTSESWSVYTKRVQDICKWSGRGKWTEVKNARNEDKQTTRFKLKKKDYPIKKKLPKNTFIDNKYLKYNDNEKRFYIKYRGNEEFVENQTIRAASGINCKVREATQLKNMINQAKKNIKTEVENVVDNIITKIEAPEIAKSILDALIESSTKEKKEKKEKRSSADFQPTELITAVCLKNDNIQNRLQLIEKIDTVEFSNPKDKQLYIEHFNNYVEKATSKKIKKDREVEYANYIKFINNKVKKIPELSNIKISMVIGKAFRCNDEICELNKGLEQIDCKADVMVKNNNNKWVGISVKKESADPISNFSIEKYLNNEELKNIRKKILKEKGINNSKEARKNREIVNKLFNTKDDNLNDYWKEVVKQMDEKSNIAIDIILSAIKSCKTIYNVYEIDGTNVYNVKDINIDKDKIKLKRVPKLNSAKLYYHFVYNDIPIYEIEIRFKGDAWGASPQFLTFKCTIKRCGRKFNINDIISS